MFNERDALKIRLEQLSAVENKLIENLHEERSYILNRLKDLDEQILSDQNETLPKDYKQLNPLQDDQSKLTMLPKKRKGRPSRRSKTTKLKEIAINLLKETHGPIRGTDLKKQIEADSDSEIANMTTFMNAVMDTNEHIIKVGRGLYVFDQDRQENGNDSYQDL